MSRLNSLKSLTKERFIGIFFWGMQVLLILPFSGSCQTLLYNDTLRPLGPGAYGLASVCSDDSFFYLAGGVNHYEPNWQNMMIKVKKPDLSIEAVSEVRDSTWAFGYFPFNAVALSGNKVLVCPVVFNDSIAYGMIIAYDKHTLDTLWTKAIAHPDTQFAAQPGATPFSELTTITATPDGGFILTGNYNKYCITGNLRSFLLKIDSLGNIQWRKTYDDVTYLYSLALAPNGGYAFINRYGGISITLTDSFGNILWKKSKLGFLSLSSPADLLYDSSGGLICTVYYMYAGTTSNPYFGVNVFRIDINTQQLSWDKYYIPYHHVESYSLHEDLGITKLPDNSYVIYSSVSDVPGFSGFILKLDQNADSVWCKNYFFGPPNQGECQLNDLLPTDDGGFLGVGFYVPNGGDIAAWMFKTDANGYVGVEESLPIAMPYIVAYPNPAVDIIQIDLAGVKDASAIRVYDPNGKLVFSEAIQEQDKEYQINLQGYIPGLYFFELLRDGKRIAAGKFMKVE